jgi:hypothetical protein
MNTNTRLTTRAAAVTICLAALFGGATACGTEDGTSDASGSRPHAASSLDLAESAKANQSAYLQRLQAEARAEAARQARIEHADAARWAHGYPGATSQSNGYGDDRRQSIEQAPHDTPPPQDAPNFDKALPSKR